MFKWLFGKGGPEADTKEVAETHRFESAVNMLKQRASYLKKEYDRTRDNSEVARNIEAYQDPAYIAEARNAILSPSNDSYTRAAYETLPVVATMFMSMASEVFPSNIGFESFWRWANGYSTEERRELVRFAYLATVWEQEQSGARSPTAFASRIVLMALAANANDEPTSKDVARQLLAFIDRVRSR